jgi:hypothetical protein
VPRDRQYARRLRRVEPFLIAVLVVSGVWLGYALDGGSIWLPLALSVAMLLVLGALLWLADSKAAEPETAAPDASDRDRRLRQQAELGGSLAPRGMGPYVNPKKRPNTPPDS